MIINKKKFDKIKRYFFKSPTFLYTDDESFLERYICSEWNEYEIWLYKNRFFSLQSLKSMYKKVKMMRFKPKISIIMPVYNPEPLEFKQAVDSILWQVYPHWELCIVDDLSNNRDYLKILGRFRDRRIKVYLRRVHTGIAGASQYAVEKAAGEYIALMDQDDEIYPDALFSFVNILQQQEIDYFYSDRDMLSPEGKRYMHFFRPDWSPEYLLSFNYTPHFEIYKKSLLFDIGGFRKEYEGSHDYDLVLRAAEQTGKIYHHSMILYSWRQSRGSIAGNYEAKSNVYESGVKAVSDAAKRRSLPVKEVVENSALWRGHYRIIWDGKILSKRKIFLITIGRNSGETDRLKQLFGNITDSLNIEFMSTDYSIENINRVLKTVYREGYVFFCDDNVIEIVSSGLIDMLGYLSIDGVEAVGCKFVDQDNKIFNVGISMTTSGKSLFSYKGSPQSEHGYGAVASVPRNVSLVFPSFWGCKSDGLMRRGCLKNGRGYFYSAVDYFMDIIKSDKRITCVPYMCLRVGKDAAGHVDDMKAFTGQWLKDGLKDKYYNPNLTDSYEDYGIKL